MVKYGYTRVSTKDQEHNGSLEAQEKQLVQAGVEKRNIKREIASASDNKISRPVLTDILNNLRPGDSLYVASFDRFSRSTMEGRLAIDKIINQGAEFQALDLKLSGDQATDDLTVTIRCAISEYEIARKRSRQKIGIARARKEGLYKGRKLKFTNKKRVIAKGYIDAGLSIRNIAKILDISPSTLYRHLKIKKEITVETYEDEIK